MKKVRIYSSEASLISLYSLTDWEWCRENCHSVTWADLMDQKLRVHVTISTRTWVRQELEEPMLAEDERFLYRLWLSQLERSRDAENIEYLFGFIAQRAEDGVWDLVIPEDELTPRRIVDYVRAFSQVMGDQLDEPYEFILNESAIPMKLAEVLVERPCNLHCFPVPFQHHLKLKPGRVPIPLLTHFDHLSPSEVILPNQGLLT